VDAHGWDARYAAAPVWTAEPNRWVREAVAPLRPGEALDVAAGEGRHAIWLAGLGWRVHAVDFSAVGLARGAELARARGVAHLVTWDVADVVAAFPAGERDLALVAYLHLPAGAMRAVLRAAARGLRPGGTLVVVGHDAANPTRGTGGPRDPAVLYAPDEVAGHLAGTGVTVTRAETVRREVAGAGRAALDALVVARVLP
jgi:SAM-dependent methyltransferase